MLDKYIEGKNMTPCEKRGYKIGDKFRVLADRVGFFKGQIVELYEDDGTLSPKFLGKNSKYNLCDDMDGAYLSLRKLKHLGSDY